MALCGAAAILLWVPTVSSAAPASVTFRFTSTRINVGASATFTYATSKLPRGAALTLQEQEGTQGVWRGVKKLKAASGSAAYTESSVGRFAFRVAAISAAHKLIAASPGQTLFAYGTVAFSTLCNNGHVYPQNLSGECASGTAQVGGRVVNYVAYGEDGNDYPDFHDWLNFPRSTCRAVTVTFGITDDTGQSGDVGYVKVVTATRDPQTGSTPFGTLGSYTARLDGRPWDLDVAESLPTDDDGEIVVNGTASCYTLSGH